MVKKFGNILDLIGETPLVPICKLNPNKNVEIWAKLESFNPGGSVKDRPALYMIQQAEKRGELTKDKTILEATSGNTGIGLALVASIKGYRVLFTMSEAVSQERVKILKAMGAEVQFTPAHLGTDGAIEYAYNLIREEPDKFWLADQFNNPANWLAHYHGTALEIWEQTGGRLQVAIASMGTTGTLMGLARRLKELDPKVKVIGVEPYLGHKIQGLKNMKESYTPGIFDRSLPDEIINIDDEEAYQTARDLAKLEGLLVGMSSGAAMAAAIRVARKMDQGRIVVMFPDGGERYLSTSLFTVKKSAGIVLYNTLTRKKEELVPLKENQFTIYSCGPTLCQFINLGQARRLVFSDLLRRYLEFKGFLVKLVVNVTDLDDSTIQGAKAAGKTLQEFTEKYYKAFMEDLRALGVRPADAYPRPSEHVEDMIKLTERLVDKGYAYEKFRSVYFDISRIETYGTLSRINLNKIKLGKTVDLDQYEKDNPRDFTLLKRATLEELKKGFYYKTRWGNVRPSWHIECYVLASKYAGEQYDIHTSSIDIIFPHHENTVAIGQAIAGHSPAKYWLHNELVVMDNAKASSSVKDEIPSVRDVLEKGYSGRELRYFLLSRHYRKPLFFSFSKLIGIRNTLCRLDNFVQKVHFLKELRASGANPDLDQIIYDLRHKFTKAMDDDLNIASALAGVFEFITQINKLIDHKGLSRDDKEKVIKALDQINSVLGILELKPMELSEEIMHMVREREEARKKKDWDRADKIREELRQMGIEVIDTKEGPIWKKLY